MPRRKPRTTRDSSSANNAVEKFKPKTIDGCNTCPPKKSCEGPEVTFETSGCLNGGGSINLRQVEDQVIPMHVECPGNGKLTITTCESIDGGGEFTANQKCGTDINLCINNSWLDRFVSARIGDGELVISTDDSINSTGETFTANQFGDTTIALGVDWSQLPTCVGGGLVWQGGCWKVEAITWDQIVGKPDCFPTCEPEPTDPPETPEPTDPPETPGPTDPADPCKDHVASDKKCENNADCPDCEECVKVESFVSSVFRTTPSSLSYDMRANRERIEDLEEQVRNLTAQLAKLMA